VVRERRQRIRQRRAVHDRDRARRRVPGDPRAPAAGVPDRAAGDPRRALVVAAGYFAVTVLQVPSLLFEEPGEPQNLLIVHGDQSLSDALDALQLWCAAVVLGLSWVVIIRRARGAGGRAQRRALEPVLVTGARRSPSSW
jgi:hypothetical protein